MALAPGMVVHLEPSTARREEFGYLVGRVRSVASFPATPDGMLRSLGNEILAQDLMRRAGDVVLEVRVTLDPSETTFTGFQWTTQAGPENKLEAGTPTAGYITVRTQTPLRLLFPSLAKRLGA
jgi:HlyD family secretion protein